MLESVCYRKTHIAFSSFISKRPYQGGWAADIAYGEGTGQCVPVWAGVALQHSGPSKPPHIISPLQQACAAAQSSRARMEDFL